MMVPGVLVTVSDFAVFWKLAEPAATLAPVGFAAASSQHAAMTQKAIGRSAKGAMSVAVSLLADLLPAAELRLFDRIGFGDALQIVEQALQLACGGIGRKAKTEQRVRRGADLRLQQRPRREVDRCKISGKAGEAHEIEAIAEQRNETAEVAHVQRAAERGGAPY